MAETRTVVFLKPNAEVVIKHDHDPQVYGPLTSLTITSGDVELHLEGVSQKFLSALHTEVKHAVSKFGGPRGH